MAHEKRRASLIKKHNLKGVNKPKRTPDHPTKSHMVLAQEGHTLKLIRFGQQGAKTCLLYTSPSPRDGLLSRMPSSA